MQRGVGSRDTTRRSKIQSKISFPTQKRVDENRQEHTRGLPGPFPSILRERSSLSRASEAFREIRYVLSRWYLFREDAVAVGVENDEGAGDDVEGRSQPSPFLCRGEWLIRAE